MKKNNKGFTLVELIIVIAIIAILAVVVAPQYLKYVESSRVSTDMDTAAAIETAINVLVADGTIKPSATDITVTWTKSSGKISGLTEGSAEETALKALLNDDDLTIEARSTAATDVTYTIHFENGTPSVKASDYKSWNQAKKADG